MESLAKYQQVCDQCDSKLSENYASTEKGKDRLSVDLKVKDGNSEYSYPQTHHFCDEACLAKHLAARAKGGGKKVAKAAMIFSKASLEVDITASTGYKKLEAK